VPNLSKNEVVEEILKIGLLPVFFNKDIKITQKIVKACADGGATVVEFTNRGEQAYDVFSELVKWHDKELPNLILGTGTILEPDTAERFIKSGANFIVGPIFNPEVAKVCNRKNIAYIPGCMTPSEIYSASKSGADIVKLFPGSVVRPEFVKAVLGPCPYFKLMPSGGVEFNSQNISSWIKAGASALNIGSNLIRKDLVKSGDFGTIKKMVEQCIRWIKEAREEVASSK